MEADAPPLRLRIFQPQAETLLAEGYERAAAGHVADLKALRAGARRITGTPSNTAVPCDARITCNSASRKKARPPWPRNKRWKLNCLTGRSGRISTCRRCQPCVPMEKLAVWPQSGVPSS